MARRWAETCPYVYYGHHPHVVQGMEEHKGSLIAYSLGNFCFDDVYTSKSTAPLVKQSPNNRAGMILELQIDGAHIAGYHTTPVYAADDRLEIGSLEGTEKLKIYSATLQDNEPDYSLRRDELLQAYLDSRRAMRDIRWYLKRLNFYSVRMIARTMYNQRQCNKNVKKLL